MFEEKYKKQVEIILQVLPLLAEYPEFALKGGTAINLFIFPLPRLSVDIDVVYLPVEEREKSLEKIRALLLSLKAKMERLFSGWRVNLAGAEGVSKLIIQARWGSVKLEVNEVLRGSIEKPIKRTAHPMVDKYFNRTPIANILVQEELFAGKICAALSRQHPRDFFDVRNILKHGYYSEKTKKLFLAYLIQTNRPISELLSPSELDFKSVFEGEFQGMVREKVSYEELLLVRRELVETIRKSLSEEDKEFLVSFKKGQPQWEKLGLGDLSYLPGVKWKLLNIKKMSARKRKQYIEKLERVLGLSSNQ